MENEKRKQEEYTEKIRQLDDDLAVLNNFVDNYEQTIEKYAPFEVSTYFHNGLLARKTARAYFSLLH